jgi:predicted acetyltransferase
MGIEVRNVDRSGLEPVIEALTVAFLERHDVARAAELVAPHWDPDRTWAAYDGDRVCGTFRSWATELTVPGGGRLPGAAIAAVTVLPTHRRRGILRAMVTAEHAAIRARGEAVGLLYASEYPIYGRFGYGPGCRVATWTLDTRATGFHGPAVSGVEVVPPSPGVRDACRAVFDAWRIRQPGEIRRRPFRWDPELGLEPSPWAGTWAGFVAVHRDADGAVDGYVRYQADERWERRQPRYVLKVNELHALTGIAYAALWRFLGETDMVAAVTADNRSPSERLPWLLDNARAAMPSDIGDGLWVRLFDVPSALASRTYERSGRVVLEVVDGELGRPVRLILDASAEGATCRPTSEPADLTLPVAALGAAYLGGSRLRDVVLATGHDEHRPGALAAMDALLATADEPWCSTAF